MICTFAPKSYGEAPSQNQSLEQHFDNLLAIEYPLLSHALSEIDAVGTLFSTGTRNSIVSSKGEHFRFGSSQIHHVSGFNKRDEKLEAIVAMATGSMRAYFYRDGNPEFRMSLHFDPSRNSKIGLRSSFSTFSPNAAPLIIEVSRPKAHEFSDNGALRLLISYRGKEFSELVWEGKRRFEHIEDLKSIAELSGEHTVDADAFLSLLSSIPGMVDDGFKLAEMVIEVPDLSMVTTSISAAKDVSVQSVSGDEAAWCSVGTLGADAVSGGTASFFYAAACIGAADLSEE
jgi:hypothetical protein